MKHVFLISAFMSAFAYAGYMPTPAYKTCKTQGECIGVLCKNNAIAPRCENGVCVCGESVDEQRAQVVCDPADKFLCKDVKCPVGKKPYCGKNGQDADVICICE